MTAPVLLAAHYVAVLAVSEEQDDPQAEGDNCPQGDGFGLFV